MVKIFDYRLDKSKTSSVPERGKNNNNKKNYLSFTEIHRSNTVIFIKTRLVEKKWRRW